MGETKSNTTAGNPVTNAVEGTTVWDETTLSYHFVTDADSGTYTGDGGVSGYFSGADPAVFDPLDAGDARDAVLRDAFVASTEAIGRVADIAFSETGSYGDADIKIGGATNLSGIYGRQDFPGSNAAAGADQFESLALYATDNNRITNAPEQGAGHFGLNVVMHELGHGLGLGHPHDGGGGTADVADKARGLAGEWELDNERYTIMSYEGGGLNQDTPRTWGHAVTPMALDIHALQSMYGKTALNTGDTTYTLTDPASGPLDVDGSDGDVSIGRAWYSIWDTGGEDAIEYGGSQQVLINLNDATLSRTDDAYHESISDAVKRTDGFDALPDELKNDLTDANYHAGGYFSRIFDDSGAELGGYSIANANGEAGAVIEDAEGGAKADVLVGNEADNTLTGRGGDDVLVGMDGDDELIGARGDDELTGGEGDDTLDGGAGDDVAYFSDVCANYEITRDEGSGRITIRHADGSELDGTDVLTDIESARFLDGTVDLTSEELECPPLDFIFLVDLSGSYADDLPNFVEAAPVIASLVRSIDERAQFAISSFVDKPVSPYGNSGDYTYRPEMALTDDEAAFENALAGLSTLSGGDTPESQWVGLWKSAMGTGLNLRENSRKIILTATDAPAHSAADYGLSEDEVTEFLENEGIDTIGGDPGREIGDPDDVGDTDPEYTGGVDDPLLAALGKAFKDASALPIIAAAGAETFYQDALDGLGGGGAVVPLSSSGSDISDAVSAALASLGGDVDFPGTSGPDTLTGTPDDDVIIGFGSGDVISGLAGDDLLDGSSGDDEIDAGEGDDTVRGGTGDDDIDGGAGDDVLEPGTGADVIATGEGFDTVSGTPEELDGDVITDFSEDDAILVRSVDNFRNKFSLSFDGTDTLLSIDADKDGVEETEITLAGVDATGFEILSGPTVDGVRLGGPTEDGEVLGGTAAGNVIDGLGGDDDLRGRRGDDELVGGEGDDRAVGHKGDDVLRGQEGADELRGWVGADDIAGGTGDDILFGGKGEDALAGGLGDDRLFGCKGEDALEGGGGDDLLVGGNGADVYVFNSGDGSDRIRGFEDDLDKIWIQTGAESFEDLSFETLDGGGVRVMYDDGDVLVRDFADGTLTGDDFLFGVPG